MQFKFFIITLITFILFFIEALIHYNVGLKSIKNGTNGIKNDKHHTEYKIWNGYYLEMPTTSETIHIGITVLIFASISGYLSAYIIHKVYKH